MWDSDPNVKDTAMCNYLYHNAGFLFDSGRGDTEKQGALLSLITVSIIIFGYMNYLRRTSAPQLYLDSHSGWSPSSWLRVSSSSENGRDSSYPNGAKGASITPLIPDNDGITQSGAKKNSRLINFGRRKSKIKKIMNDTTPILGSGSTTNGGSINNSAEIKRGPITTAAIVSSADHHSVGSSTRNSGRSTTTTTTTTMSVNSNSTGGSNTSTARRKTSNFHISIYTAIIKIYLVLAFIIALLNIIYTITDVISKRVSAKKLTERRSVYNQVFYPILGTIPLVQMMFLVFVFSFGTLSRLAVVRSLYLSIGYGIYYYISQSVGFYFLFHHRRRTGLIIVLFANTIAVMYSIFVPMKTWMGSIFFDRRTPFVTKYCLSVAVIAGLHVSEDIFLIIGRDGTCLGTIGSYLFFFAYPFAFFAAIRSDSEYWRLATFQLLGSTHISLEDAFPASFMDYSQQQHSYERSRVTSRNSTASVAGSSAYSEEAPLSAPGKSSRGSSRGSGGTRTLRSTESVAQRMRRKKEEKERAKQRFRKLNQLVSQHAKVISFKKIRLCEEGYRPPLEDWPHIKYLENLRHQASSSDPARSGFWSGWAAGKAVDSDDGGMTSESDTSAFDGSSLDYAEYDEETEAMLITDRAISDSSRDRREFLKMLRGSRSRHTPSSLTDSPLDGASRHIPGEQPKKAATRQLGAGATSKVYRGKYKDRDVAVKGMIQIDKKASDKMNWTDLTLIFRETVLSSSVAKHPNIVEFIGVSLTPGRFYLVYEFCWYSDLEQVLIKNLHQSWIPELYTVRTRLNFLVDIANGMAFLHSQGFVHRDLKTANVLVSFNNENGRFEAKLCDFGVSSKRESAPITVPAPNEDRVVMNTGITPIAEHIGSFDESAPEMSSTYFPTEFSAVDDAASVGPKKSEHSVTHTAYLREDSQQFIDQRRSSRGRSVVPFKMGSESGYRSLMSHSDAQESPLIPDPPSSIPPSKKSISSSEKSKHKGRSPEEILGFDPKWPLKKLSKPEAYERNRRLRGLPIECYARDMTTDRNANVTTSTRRLKKMIKEQRREVMEHGNEDSTQLSELDKMYSLSERVDTSHPVLNETVHRTAHVGTPAFLSPEILLRFLESKGAARRIEDSLILNAPRVHSDYATDVFAFGVLMWSVMTCQLPYSGLNALQMIKLILSEFRLDLSGTVKRKTNESVRDSGGIKGSLKRRVSGKEQSSKRHDRAVSVEKRRVRKHPGVSSERSDQDQHYADDHTTMTPVSKSDAMMQDGTSLVLDEVSEVLKIDAIEEWEGYVDQAAVSQLCYLLDLCWAHDPRERPTFASIHRHLTLIREQTVPEFSVQMAEESSYQPLMMAEDPADASLLSV